jgi:uncharacterized protein
MRLEHEFTVPVPVEQAWDVLLDVERVAPCMPGATVESVDGDSFTGKVKVRVGPVTVGYTGTASFVEKDAAARRVVVQAKGRETRGAGTAAATVTAQLRESGAGTAVTVETDLAITGRPAQFGRGVMDDVGAKLLGQFADCLADRLGAGEPAAASNEEGAPSGAPGGPGGAVAGEQRRTAPPEERPTPDTINLVEVAGGSIAKRVGPVLAALAIAALVWIIVRGIRG